VIEMALKYGNISTRRRLGCWLDIIGTDSALTRKLERALRETQSFIPLVPEKNPSGKTDLKWGVLINYGTKGD
jgi:predicted transcriptional regulator of viral defense system